MSVIFNVFPGLQEVKFVLCKHVNDFNVDRNWLHANYDATIISSVYLFVPGVSSNVFNRVSFSWVSFQYFFDQISAFVIDKLRNSIVRIKNFLIK